MMRQGFADGTGIRWAIRRQAGNGKLLGTCGFNYWHQQNKCCGLGYELAAAQWGRGYASEAVQAIVAYAFSDAAPIAIKRIEATTSPGNPTSDRVLEKAGFTFEGVLRDKGFWKIASRTNLGIISLLLCKNNLPKKSCGPMPIVKPWVAIVIGPDK